MARARAEPTRATHAAACRRSPAVGHGPERDSADELVPSERAELCVRPPCFVSTIQVDDELLFVGSLPHLDPQLGSAARGSKTPTMMK